MTDPARLYRESAVRGASPLGLIVILYDEIIRNIRKAQRAFETNNVEQRSNSLRHALEVVGYLHSILNFEKGGDVARNLARFYTVMRAKLVECNTSPARDTFEMLAHEFANVAEAWQQAERISRESAQPTNLAPEMALVGSSAAASGTANRRALSSR